MTARYYQPLPEIPDALLNYCLQNNYSLSLKRKYILSQIVNLNDDTSIDELLSKTSGYCNSISRSSVYLVLQWMITHNLISKTLTDDDLRISYRTNFEKLNRLSIC